ncbi:hypothetical protein GGR57DRAFT_514523 [Xylariaceae sp. FL1272]|nr:hypothetical protein GGR57DRAFT_514523 [Xylariaceae sp. FL1272]
MRKTVLKTKNEAPEKKPKMETATANQSGGMKAEMEGEKKTVAQPSKDSQKMEKEVSSINKPTEHNPENEEGVHRNVVEQKVTMVQSTVQSKIVERESTDSDAKQKSSAFMRTVEPQTEQQKVSKPNITCAVVKLSESSDNAKDPGCNEITGKAPKGNDIVPNGIVPSDKKVSSGKPGGMSTVRKQQPTPKIKGARELEQEPIDKALKKLSKEARRKMSQEEEAEIEKVRVKDETPRDVVDYYMNPRLKLQEKWKKGAWEHRRIWKDW